MFKKSYVVKTEEKGKSKVLSGGFCLRYSKAEQRVLQWLHICCSKVDSYSSAPESNKKNPQDRALALPFFFRLKHISSFKNIPTLAPSESYSYWFQGNFSGYVCF